MGALVRRLVGVASLLLVTPLLVAPAQASEDTQPEVASPRAASQSCVAGQSVTGVANASGRIVQAGAGVNAARVYAFDLETGSIACVLSASDGTYTLPLPGVTAGAGLRRPASGWVISASAPSGSNLGGTSRTVAWNSVSVSATLAMSDLMLGSATALVRPRINGQAVGAPTLVCAGFDSSAWAGPCGVAPANSSDPVALATGTTNPQSVYLESRVAGSWWSAWGSSSAQGATVSVELGQESSWADQECSEGKAVRGKVTREVDGVSVGVLADVELLAQSTNSANPIRTYLGGGQTDRDGNYTACARFDNLPAGGILATLPVVVAASVLGGVKTVTSMASECTNGCSGEDVTLEETADVGGQVTYSGVSGIAGQVAFSPWSFGAGSLVMGNPSMTYEVGYGITGPSGLWGVAFLDGLNPVPNGGYLATVRATNARDGYPETYKEFTTTNSAASVDIVVKRGNFTGQVRGADGSPVDWTWLFARQVECTSSCSYRYASTSSQGWFAMDLPDGTFDVQAGVPWGNTNSVTTTRRVVVADGSVVSFAGAAPGAPLVFQLLGPNARFVVKAAGQDLADAYMSLQMWSDSGFYEWAGSAYTSGSGVMSARLEPGEYLVMTNSGGSELVPSSYQHWRVTESGGDISIEVCSFVGRVRGEPCPAGSSVSSLPQNSEGDWEVNLPSANLVATVQSPDGSVNLPNSEVCLIQETTQSGNSWREHITCQVTNAAGKVAFSLPPAGSFTVQVQPPWDSTQDWVTTSFKFQTDASGNVCSGASANSCTPLAGPNVSLPLTGPNIIATIRGAGGAELTNGWAHVERACSQHVGCREWVTGVSVSSRGRISLKLPASDQAYYLRIYPGNLNDGSVETTFELRITDADVVQNLSLQLKSPNVTGTVTDSTGRAVPYVSINVERSAGGGWSWVNAYASTSLSGDYRLLLDPGTYRLRLQPQADDRSRAVATVSSTFTVTDTALDLDVTMGAPNLTGMLKSPDGVALANSWIQVQKWYDAYGYYGWSDEVPGTDSGSSGRFGLNLPDGRWRLVVNPPWGTLTASRTIVPLRSNGTGVCPDTSPSTACTADRYLTSTYEITLDRPNASGQVRMPDGVGQVPYAWIEVQRYIDDATGFSWDFDLPEAVTGPAATFALKLPIGRWKLTAHPDSSVVDATRNSVDVTVDGGGLCLTVNAPCAAPNLLTPGNLRISLRAPNVAGTVTAGGTPVPNAWAQVERWNTQWNYWEWVNNYAWTRDTGRYALSILDDGDYRVRANASSGLRGFKEGYSYLRVASGEICELADAPTVGVNPPCTGAGATGDSVTVTTALTPANVVAEVTGENDAPTPWTWVQLQERVNGDWHWREGNHTLEDGSVSLTVSTDDSAVFRLRIEPPWGSDVEYVRTYAEFIAYREGAVTRACAVADWTPSTRTCAKPVTSGDPLEVALNTGGLRGRVTAPDGQTGISSSWIEVQQWRLYAGSPDYGWWWTDAYTHSRPNGDFTLALDAPAIYRITAYPTWPNTSGWSRRTTIVQYDGAGQWCVQDPISGNGPESDFGACEGPWGTSVDRLLMPLRTSNVIGEVVFDDLVNGVPTSRPMPYGWVSIQKSTGEWVTSLSTSDQGRFAVFLEDDTYVITAYPNWRFTQRPPISKTVIVSNGVASGLPGGELRLDLDEIPPNLFLTLTQITGEPFEGERIIAVERDADGDAATVDWSLEDSYSASTDGASPNVAGFNLPPGIYRLRVVPDLGKVISSGGIVEVTVPDSGVVYTSVAAGESSAATP